jgi:hypothetical protein
VGISAPVTPAHDEFADDLAVQRLPGGAEAESEVEALGKVLVRDPEHCYTGLATAARLLAYRLHGEAAVAAALMVGCDVQSPIPTPEERVLRLRGVEAGHDKADRFLAIGDKAWPRDRLVRVGHGKRPSDRRLDGFLFGAYLDAARGGDVLRGDLYQREDRACSHSSSTHLVGLGFRDEPEPGLFSPRHPQADHTADDQQP